jgi:spore germination protein KC
MKRFVSIILLCLNLCSILAGCRDFKDIDRRLFVVAIGIDISPDNKKEMELTFKTAIAKEVGAGEDNSVGKENSEIYSIRGDNLVDIFRIIKTKAFIEPDFSHMKLILFGGEFIRHNPISETVDFFVRRRDFQNIAYTAVALPSAKEMLSHDLTQENFAGNGLFMKFGEGSENPYALSRRIYQLYHQVITPGISPSLPIIELEEDKYVVERIAILSDNKTKLELGRDESKLFNMLSRNVTLASLTLQEEDENLGIGLNNVSGKIKYDTKSKSLNYNVHIEATATIEQPSKTYRGRDELSDKFSRLICKKTMELLEKLKDNNVDPLELEIKYWENKRDFWFNKAWLNNELTRVKFNVSCDIEIISTGNLK